MSENPGAGSAVPSELIGRLERQLGGRIADVAPRAGNGASRQGAEVVIRFNDGWEARAYLSFDTRTSDPRRRPCFRREVAILAALSGSLKGAGVSAPELLASDAGHLALLTRLVEGRDRFDAATPPQERATAERDVVGQLAALHRLNPLAAPLDGFDDPVMPNSQRIAARLCELRADNLATSPDPILLLALDWLERHVPPDHGPSVIVHGDAGPGNFLHHQGRVTALLDWELVHYGDPLEDLAAIWVRSLFQPFLRPSAVFAAYEAAGGAPVDVDRVRYHRLYFQLGFMVENHANLHGPAPAPTALIGTSLLFEAAHTHVVVRSLAELTGVRLAEVPAIEAPPGPADLSFARALDDLREVIAPRAADPQARAKATSLARLVKWWRARDRYGSLHDAAEMADVSAARGDPVASVADARRRLATAIVERRIGFDAALQLCNRRVVRHTALMGEAMGSLKDCYFAPLD